ncbi:MAG: hypothetical protein ISR95_02550 [Candidatus Marinimicrobia bacterium]|nr:hypothetical protein [Candidatus Neomarinimicrobiota bacterium]
MNMIISREVNFSFGLPNKKELQGKVPTVSRMMALACFYEQLIKDGKIKSVSDIGRLEGVTQQRVSQVMSLLWLSPKLQERLLFLPKQTAPNQFITAEKAIQIAKEMDFERQEKLFINSLY